MNKYDYYIGILFSNYFGKANWFELSGGLKIDPGWNYSVWLGKSGKLGLVRIIGNFEKTRATQGSRKPISTVYVKEAIRNNLRQF